MFHLHSYDLVPNILSGGADNLILRFDISRLAVGSSLATRPTQAVYRRHDVSRTLSKYPSISHNNPITTHIGQRAVRECAPSSRRSIP